MLTRAALFDRLLPLIYVVLAFPIILFQVFATPPFQVADEGNHFLRALQIADGHFVAQRLSAADAGGKLDPNAMAAADGLDALKFHPETKLDPQLLAGIASLHWGGNPKVPASFVNTANYPFFFYVPAALGIRLGKLSGLSVLETLYLGRLLTAVCATLLAAWAIGLCAKGRTALFVILSFPMVLSLFASVSQDGLALAAGAFVVGVWSHYLGRDRDVPLGLRCGAALLLGAIIAARPPLIALFGLMFLPTTSERRLLTRSWLSRDGVLALAVGFVPVVFGVIALHRTKIAFRPELGVSESGQLAFILHHPFAAVRVAAETLHQLGSDYLQQMVGVLGWLDTVMPPFYYDWIAVALVLAALVECVSPARGLKGLSWLAQWLFVLAAAGGVFIALYLTWTPVGAATVEGFQGRYLLVPAMFAIIVLPHWPWRRSNARSERERSADCTAMPRVFLCTAVALCNIWVVPITIVHRYYG